MEIITINDTATAPTQAAAPDITELALLRFQAALQIYCVELTVSPGTANQATAVQQADALLATLGLAPVPATVATSGVVKS